MKAVIHIGKGVYVNGEQIKTRGNDEEYPTFVLDDGKRRTVAVKDVIAKISEE